MEQNMETIKGTVGRIVLPVKEDGFTIFDIKTDAETVRVVGHLGAVTAADELELTGCWEDKPPYGKRFAAVSYKRTLSTAPDSIVKFLTGCKIKGLTKSLAAEIVAEFGEFTFDVLTGSPEKLKALDGMTDSVYEEICTGLTEILAVRALTDRFQQYDIPPRYAQRAYSKWNAAAWDTVRENPFLLCQDCIGLDFRTADRLAEQLGLPGNFPFRLIEGMCSRLKKDLADGSTCMECERLLNTAAIQLSAAYHDVKKALEQAVSEQCLFVHDSHVYLPEYYRAEDYIASRIAAKLRFSPAEDFDCAAAIAKEEAETGIEYAELQKQAITTAFSRGIMIMTGGPGTGKTTTLRGVIHLCKRAKSKILLAAPTGRAAKRMTDLTGCPASTIHRLLGAVPEENEQFTFQHNENVPLKADVVIIDEFSMVDTLLFESLLRGISLTCRVILVGDEDQLPSVGAGHLLHSLIESGQIPVVRLKEIFRQAQQSLIVKAAHEIISGNMGILDEGCGIITNANDDDCFFFDCPQNIVPTMVRRLCTERLPEKRGYDPLADIQVISPRKSNNPLGVVELNKLLQNALNPKNGENCVPHGDYEFRVGDKVMQLQNDYSIEWTKEDGEEGTGIFNGDTGIITEIDSERNVTVNFDERIVVFENGHIGSLTLAYASTVHKSQGSEFSAVVLVLPDFPGKGLMNRNLLYTAVTRAKELLIILGRRETMRQMIAACQSDTRCTCLAEMLRQMAGGQSALPDIAQSPENPFTEQSRTDSEVPF